ncbi:MAG: hypothetical protein KA436_12750 [Oligoflexales bacterium]|nr:hypothetical protein [Oligoflexales bacterium]
MRQSTSVIYFCFLLLTLSCKQSAKRDNYVHNTPTLQASSSTKDQSALNLIDGDFRASPIKRNDLDLNSTDRTTFQNSSKGLSFNVQVDSSKNLTFITVKRTFSPMYEGPRGYLKLGWGSCSVEDSSSCSQKNSWIAYTDSSTALLPIEMSQGKVQLQFCVRDSSYLAEKKSSICDPVTQECCGDPQQSTMPTSAVRAPAPGLQQCLQGNQNREEALLAYSTKIVSMSQNALEKLPISKAEIARLKDLPFPEGDDVMKKAIVNLASYEPETFANMMGSHASDFTSLIEQTLKDPILQNLALNSSSESETEGLGLSQSSQPAPTHTVCVPVGRTTICRQEPGPRGSTTPQQTATVIVSFSSIAIVAGVATAVGGLALTAKTIKLHVQYSNAMAAAETAVQNSKFIEAEKAYIALQRDEELSTAAKKRTLSADETKEILSKEDKATLRKVDQDFLASPAGKEMQELSTRKKELTKEKASSSGRGIVGSILSALGAGILGAGIYGVLSSYQGLQLADDEDYMTTVQALWRAIQDLGPIKDCG